MNTFNEASIKPYWWVNSIMQFDHIEIQPCTVIDYDDNDQEVIGACNPEEALFWTVYGHYCPWAMEGGVEALEAFITEDEAQKFYNLLVQLYPHLSDEPVRPSFVSRRPTIH